MSFFKRKYTLCMSRFQLLIVNFYRQKLKPSCYFLLIYNYFSLVTKKKRVNTPF